MKKKDLWKIIVPVVIVAVLVFAFWYGGDAAGSRGWAAPSESPAAETPEVSARAPDDTQLPELSVSPPPSPEGTAEPDVPETPAPDDAQPSEPGGTAASVPPAREEPSASPSPDEGTAGPTCTISISCTSILNNLDLCDPAKVDLVPEDGWILEPITVPFHEGESVFNVLQRTCKQQKIQMEFTNTPVYNTTYIEGIANLYQFDVGETSGWKYSVNGAFPSVGCSGYPVADGDVICWVYACDLSEWE